MVHPFLITGLKTATLVVGALITFYSAKAYRRTGAEALRALAIGFGIVTLGSLTAGVLDQFVLAGQRELALVVESALTAVGFAAILYSLFVE